MSEMNQNSWGKEAIIKGFKKSLKKKISVFFVFNGYICLNS